MAAEPEKAQPRAGRYALAQDGKDQCRHGHRLSALGLDTIEETDTEIRIGAMATLRDLETNTALNAYTAGAVREAVRHIVGVQFRNCATVGGSIYGRFGFSDVLTLFLALDCEVELYKAGPDAAGAVCRDAL